MADSKKLSDMLDNLIDSNPDQAQVDFHDYLQDKMAEITGTEMPGNDAKTDEE